MATSRTMRQLLALVHEYTREPAPVDSDAAAERDLAYFDRILGLLGQQDDPDATHPAGGQSVPGSAEEYRVRWEIDLSAGGPVEAARQARNAQLRPDSLATVFEVVRRDGAVNEPDWSLAETIDLAAHTKSDDQALDEIARVLRVRDWCGGDDMPYIEELVRLTGRDTVEPVTPDEEIDWR
jgi:hypothetical protein